MPIRFHHHDSLRIFIEVAHHSSFSAAGEALNMTKGAVSYQIKTLEGALGFSLFERTARGVSLTRRGRNLLEACRAPYDAIETELRNLKRPEPRTLTVGVSTYFAARWLSARLMSFLEAHADIQLRLQPMVRLFDLEEQGIDIAIRWGAGQWRDAEITPFKPLPAFPVGNAAAWRLVEERGLEQAIPSFTLLRDDDESRAWTDWLDIAGLPHQTRRDTLIVPDPNVRVQAVANGQGIALMDELIDDEIGDGALFRLSEKALSDYGYFLARPDRPVDPGAADIFVEWILKQ